MIENDRVMNVNCHVILGGKKHEEQMRDSLVTHQMISLTATSAVSAQRGSLRLRPAAVVPHWGWGAFSLSLRLLLTTWRIDKSERKSEPRWLSSNPSIGKLPLDSLKLAFFEGIALRLLLTT